MFLLELLLLSGFYLVPGGVKITTLHHGFHNMNPIEEASPRGIRACNVFCDRSIENQSSNALIIKTPLPGDEAFLIWLFQHRGVPPGTNITPHLQCRK